MNDHNDENFRQFITDTGGPIYPCEIKGHIFGGITLRDSFAAKAMQSMFANHYHAVLDGSETFKEAAKEAYQMADAMLKERVK